MNKIKFTTLILTIIAVYFTSCQRNNIHERKEWGSIYKAQGIDSAGFEVYEQAKERAFYYNKARGNARFVPASTFKILLNLVALETGIAPSEELIIKWNGATTHNPAWHKDMNMREAFNTSSEPYYRELASRIGKATLQKWVDTIRYGNKKLSDSIMNTWHDGTTLITLDEQVGFMKKLYFDELPFSKRAMRIMRSMMLQESGDKYKLYYKTGMATNKDEDLYWLVGYVEDSTNHPYFFANNFTTKGNDSILRPQRIDITKAILNNLGLPIPIAKP
jgi:beta-lactamase class D